ncbi:MAG: sulfurtransferase TusA family protein [Thermodesulfobacteriota bacterium]
MSETVDARGLSCPQPVIITLDKIKTLAGGELAVLVDTDTSKENVSRAANSQGWRVSEEIHEGDGYKLILRKA